MSKLNRKEFKDLLLEWNKNFINEKFTPSFQNILKNTVRTRLPIKVICINKGLELKKLLIENGVEVKDTGSGTSYFEKNNINNDVISDLAKKNKIQFASNEEAKFFDKSLRDSNPSIIVDISIGDQVYNNVSNSIESVIPWIFHDLFHDILESHMVSVNRYIKGNPYTKGPEYLEYLSGDYREFSKPEIENEEITSEYIPFDDEYDISEEFVRFFKDIKFTPFVGNHDIVPSIWAFCVTKLTSKNEIDELNLSDIAKEKFKEFYEDAHISVKKIIQRYKNEFILFHRNNENELNI